MALGQVRQRAQGGGAPEAGIIDDAVMGVQHTGEDVLCEENTQGGGVGAGKGLHQTLAHRLQIGFGAGHLGGEAVDGPVFRIGKQVLNIDQRLLRALFAFDTVALDPIA